MYDLKDKRWLQNRNKSENKVYLTIDDGPSNLLPSILDILLGKDVQAVFFWEARLLNKDRPWKRVINEGHKIGSHAFYHNNLTELSYDQQYLQIKDSVVELEEITGEKIEFFRPPYGRYNEDTMSIVEELKLTPVMWEITSYDWENKLTPETIVTNVVDHVKNGSIILLHELEQTVSVLPKIIDKVREKGFEFVLL